MGNAKRSGVFRTFMKVLMKPKKLDRTRMPLPEALFNCKEYKPGFCETDKLRNCEMTYLDIKSSTKDTDSLKLLVFKLSKFD